MSKSKKVLVLAIVLVGMCVIYSLPRQLHGAHLDHVDASVKSAVVHGNFDAPVDSNGDKILNVDDKSVVGENQGSNDVSGSDSDFVRDRPVHPKTITTNTSRSARLFINQENKGGHKKPSWHLQGRAQTTPVYGRALGPNDNHVVKSAVKPQDVFRDTVKSFDKNTNWPNRSTVVPLNDPENHADHAQSSGGPASQTGDSWGHPRSYTHDLSLTEKVVPVRNRDGFVQTSSTVGDGLVADANTDDNSKRRTIVYSCNATACGGWADRQKGLVSAYVLSVLMGRHFKLYMPRPCDLATVMAPNQVDWRLTSQETEGRSVSHVHGVNADHTYELVKRMLGQSDLNIAETDADYVFITWNMEVVHMLRTHPHAQRVPWLAAKMSTGQVYRYVLGALFQARPALQAQLQAVRSERPPNTKLACAHIRTGDDADLRGWHFFNTLDSLHVLFHFLQQFNDSRHYRVFFASDKLQVLTMARAQFPAVFLSTTGPVTHVDLDHSKDACAGLAHAILDQLVLATCDVLVLSRSGLGKMAAFLRNTDHALYLFHGFKITSYRRSDDFGDRLW